jgi:hypothetical protein
MWVPTIHLEKVIGSKVLAGDNMQGVKRIITPDVFASSVFDKMRSIAGDDELPASKSSDVKHITPEEAIKELLEMQRVSVVQSPTASR